jgi:hypothetical protein
MANIRQGRSSTPRCEPLSERDIQWAYDRICEVVEAYRTLVAYSPRTASPPSDHIASPSGEEVHRLLEQVQRRGTWMREVHKLDIRQFVDRAGQWGTFDFVNDALHLISHLTAAPSPAQQSGELREAFLQTQMMLEQIVHLKSTDFAEVRARIMANRQALASTPSSSPSEMGREDIARIIDPGLWAQHDAKLAELIDLDGDPLGGVIAHDKRDEARRLVAGTLRKADAILALSQPTELGER